jgi:hypothetical protein
MTPNTVPNVHWRVEQQIIYKKHHRGESGTRVSALLNVLETLAQMKLERIDLCHKDHAISTSAFSDGSLPLVKRRKHTLDQFVFSSVGAGMV